MAKGWRRFLEEESEHQWLAISLFFVFILIGAFVIHGTSKLTGMDIGNNQVMEDARVLQITYDSDGDHSALVSTTDGTYLYQYIDDKKTNIIDPNNDDSASNIRYITELSNGTIATSNVENSILLIKDSTISNLEISETRGVFNIIDLSENLDENSNSMLLVTDEGGYTSFRGVDSNGTPSSHMPSNDEIEWNTVDSISDNEWIATGIIYSSPVGQENNSAAPVEIKPVIGHVIWTGGGIAPMLNKMYIGSEGEFHSTIKIGDQMIIAGTTQTTIFNSNDLTFEHLSITSSAAIKGGCEVIWFFGSMNSDSVIRWTLEGYNVIELQHPLPIEIEAFGTSSKMIYMHGTDSNGQAKVLTFDTSSPGSIESGRGFLNFSFLLIFTTIFAVMGWNVIERMKN